ncbi:MAG: YhgE/Pip family protein [Bacillus sp. (in: firmicutes)]
MKKVWTIYAIDWRRISRSSSAIFLIIALMILPSMYAWFNIKALWDPYGNTSGIKIAVANDDLGITINDHEMNIGQEIVDVLKENESLGWTFVSKKKADKGVLYGDYYASIYIPKDFSENLSSILSDNLKKPEIIYTSNDKINAIAPKITSKGATTITTEVSEQFVEVVSEAVLTAFDEIGIKLKEDLPTIRKLENKLYQLRDAIPKINEFGDKVIELNANLPEIQEKVDKVLSFPTLFPKINEAGQSILKVQDALPKVETVGEKVTVLQENIPEIQNVATKVNEFNQNFGSVKTTLSSGIEQAKKASEVIDALIGILPKIQELAENGEGYVDIIQQFTDKLDASFDTIANAVKLNLTIANSVAESIVNLTKPSDSAADSTQINSLLTQLSTLLQSQITHIQSLINHGVSSASLQTLLQKLQNAQSNVQAAQQALANGNTEKIYAEAVKIHNATSTILNSYDDTYLPAIRTALNAIKTDIVTAENVVQEVQQQLPNVSDILTSTGEIVEKAIETLEKYEAALPEIEQTIQKATTAMNDNLDGIVSGINTAADFYKNHFTDLQDKVNKASVFVENDLPGLEEKLQNSAEIIEEKMPTIVEAIEMAGDLAENQLSQLTAKVKETAEKLEEMKASVSLEDVIKLLRRDVQSDSDFLANPIKLKEVVKFPIANYGSASTPFYTALAIWVGAILLVSMLSVDVEMPKEMYKPHHFYFGRGMTFLSIALVQAAIVSLGDIFLLKADIHDRWEFVLFSLIISFVFTTVVYTLVSVFGNIGKGLAIILLVLQISGSGGNFPIEVSSAFFQRLYPFLPFTYAVNLLREGVGGVLWVTASTCITVLLSIAALFMIFGTILKKPLMNLVKGFSENAKKSKIIH